MINFFTQDFKFTLRHKTKVRQWLHSVTKTEKAEIAELNYIFGSDDYLLALNKKHLNHNTLTDIITFDNSTPRSPSLFQGGGQGVVGDIFISIERVKENAKQYNIPFEHELHRVWYIASSTCLATKTKNPQTKLG